MVVVVAKDWFGVLGWFGFVGYGFVGVLCCYETPNMWWWWLRRIGVLCCSDGPRGKASGAKPRSVLTAKPRLFLMVKPQVVGVVKPQVVGLWVL